MAVLRLLTLALFTLSFSTFNAQGENRTEPVKIGVILPLSGEAASWGEAIKNGLELGSTKLSPELRSRISWVFEDDQLIAKNTIAAFNKLTSIDRVTVVISASSGTSKAIAPLAEQKKIPLIAIASDPKVVASRKYAVNFWVTPEEEIRVLVPEVVRRGYRRIARITTTQEGALAVRDTMDRMLDPRIKVALDEDYPPEIKDFKTYIAKIKALPDIDAVMIMLLPGQLGNFAKQLRQMDVKLPVFGVEVFEDSDEVAVADGGLLGAWYVNALDPDNSFIAEYRENFPEGLGVYLASNGHDLALLVGEAVSRGASSEQINDFLHSVRDFKGALGTYSASGDNRFTLPAGLKVVTAEGFANLNG